MRSATAFLLIVPTLAVLATACDSPTPQEPLDRLEEVSEASPTQGEPAALIDTEHWADGYLYAGYPTTASYSPDAFWAFNRTGSSIQVTKPAGTTGRYLVKFGGLSDYLGTKSTLQLTGHGVNDTYCKPVTAYLITSQVEVRCFQASTGAEVNAHFTALVLRKRANHAFAYAHLPTEATYAPQAKGSWNPKGAIKVTRYGTGSYQVVFEGLGALAASTGNGGHVQVSPVGTGRNHCKVASWGGNPNLGIAVECYNQAGVRTDSKFNVLFLLPRPHLAYAWADQPTTSSYLAHTYYRYNPLNGGITITRYSAGYYNVVWAYADPAIFDGGTVQVTAYGGGNTQCKVEEWDLISARVRCFAPSGALVDSYFTVLLGS